LGPTQLWAKKGRGPNFDFNLGHIGFAAQGRKDFFGDTQDFGCSKGLEGYLGENPKFTKVLFQKPRTPIFESLKFRKG